MIILDIELTDGDHEEIEVDENETELHLTSIENIDLTPLSSCRNLVKFSLIDNSFEHIDLTPLSSCTKLQFLWLKDNELDTIDLSPLVHVVICENSLLQVICSEILI